MINKVKIIFFRLRCSADSRRRPYRRRHKVQVRRLAVAGPSQGVHPARPFHEEQVRRSPHLQQARPHGGALSAWVRYNGPFQCDQIWQIFATLAHYYSTLAISKVRIL